MKDLSKNPSFSSEEVRQLLSSPEAQQLIALLQQDGGGRLQQAAQAVQKGNMDGAKEALKPLARDPQTAALLEKLGKQHKDFSREA